MFILFKAVLYVRGLFKRINKSYSLFFIDSCVNIGFAVLFMVEQLIKWALKGFQFNKPPRGIDSVILFQLVLYCVHGSGTVSNEFRM